MINWPEMLLIGGTGRNVGKTTFACLVIGALSKMNTIYGIKISPHFHELQPSLNILFQNSSLVVAEETDSQSNKDSSLMLKAGAKKVFYIQTDDNSIPGMLHIMRSKIPEGVAVVCESSALRNYLKPGLFVVLMGNGKIDKNAYLQPLADRVFRNFDFDISSIKFENCQWKG